MRYYKITYKSDGIISSIPENELNEYVRYALQLTNNEIKISEIK